MSVHDYTPDGPFAAPVGPKRCRETVPDGGRTAEKLVRDWGGGVLGADEIVRRLRAEAADRPEQPR